MTSLTLRQTERSRDEQYRWLNERRDPASSLEGEFLATIYRTGRRLPDRAQYRPESDVYTDADFYYERESVPGVCVFCDGPDHDQPQRKARDESERTKLESRGYRVVVIRHGRYLEDQINAHADVFGRGPL
jgi:hypothetical protein